MKALVFTLLIGLALPALAGPAVHVDSDLPLPPPTRFPLVCQEPMEIGLRASSGTFSEVADDIPQDLVGLEFDTVVLYLAEWLAPWQDPDGITLNFYDALCPPAMDPVMTLYTPWSEIEAVFQGATSSMIMYKVTLSLDSAIEILPAMSIGAQVETSWGTAMPSAGFLGSGWVNGCGELYWDDYYGGIPRWTPASQTAAGDIDLAYCLDYEATAVPEDEVEMPARLLGNHPNPFNPRTEIVFALEGDARVDLTIYDLAGRRVRTLLADASHGMGTHAVAWDGATDAGRPSPSGVYLARFEADGRGESHPLTLIR